MALYTTKQARRSVIDTVTFRVLSQVATVVGFVIFVRAMPEVDFGIFNLLYAFIPVFSTVASLGLEQTLRRYQPEYLSVGNNSVARWLVRFVASARFGTNVIFLSAILLAWNNVAPFFKLAPYRGEFALFCLLVLLHFQARILQIALAGRMLHRFSVGSVAILSIVKLQIYVGLAWYDALDLTTAISADALSNAIAYVFLRRAYRRHCLAVAPSAARRPNTDECKRLFRYGLLNNFNDAGSLVLSAKSDNFFIAAFMDPFAVGVYAFYTRLSQMIEHVQPARYFENVIQPLFFAVAATDSHQRIPKYFTLLLNTSLLLQWPALTYSVVYHEEIVSVVFDGKFLEYSRLLPLVVAFSTLEVIARPVTLVAQFEEKAGVILLSKVVAIYNVIALITLIPVAGVFGAALATGSAALIKNLFIWWHVKNHARWLNFLQMLFFSTVVWCGAAIVCVGARNRLDLPAIGHLLIGFVVCIFAVALHVRTPALADSDRRLLGSMLSGREARLLQLAGVLRRERGAH